MVDDNYNYTKEQIAKNLVLLEDHLKQNPCPDCVNKHMLATEGYADEGILMAENPQEQLTFLNLSSAMRNARKKFNQMI
jgi:hypothetical protein